MYEHLDKKLGIRYHHRNLLHCIEPNTHTVQTEQATGNRVAGHLCSGWGHLRDSFFVPADALFLISCLEDRK